MAPRCKSARRSLNSLPFEILHQIAIGTDGPTAWAMKDVCRGWRAAGNEAAQPYLADQKVTVKPRLTVDGKFLPALLPPSRQQGQACSTLTAYFPCHHEHACLSPNPSGYHSIEPLSSSHYAARNKKLSAISRKFLRHLKAYPESATQLKRLTVEIRDDDSGAGWSILERMAPQLEHLTLHIFDRFYRVDGKEQQGAAWSILDHQNMLSYAQIVNFSRLSSLTLLTSLTIHATTRSLHHFMGLGPYLPNLRLLTLADHWQSEAVPFGWPGEIALARNMTETCLFDNLESLTVIGSRNWARTVVPQLLSHLPEPTVARAPNLRRLRIQTTSCGFCGHDDHPVTSCLHSYRVFDDVSEAITLALKISALEIYGPQSEDVLRSIGLRQYNYPSEAAAYQAITDLKLETTDIQGGISYLSWTTVSSSCSSDRSTLTCMLQNPLSMPRLPALRRICFVKLGATTNYNPSPLQRLFDLYPSLEQACCVSQYPNDHTGNSMRSDVLSCVTRRPRASGSNQ